MTTSAFGVGVVLQGDARRLPFPDESIDLIVTSPPYFALRDYRDSGGSLAGQLGAEDTPADYVAALLDCTREWARVLKPAGSLWVNLGDKYSQYEGPRTGHGRSLGGKERRSRDEPLVMPRNTPQLWGIPPKSLMGLPWRYALGCVDDVGLLLRAEVVWSKTNGMPESVRDRVRRSHEQWFHLTKQARYYANTDAIRVPYAADSIPRRGRTRKHDYAPPGQDRHNGLREGHHPAGALPGSVWQVPARGVRVPPELGIKHHAAFPVELPRRIAEGWCPPGGTVLDPLGGSGTTALAALVTGRVGITLDMSADYCRLAQWRLNDPRERARAAGRPASPSKRADRVRQQGLLFEHP